MSIPFTWGTEPGERALAFPCDRYVDRSEGVYYRGVTVGARPETLFRWLCQLRVAPYSYDWIDNGGRPSPRTLTPGADVLAIGQPVLRIFRLVEFEPYRHLTLRGRQDTRAPRLFGDLAITYLIVPRTPDISRLLVKIAIRYQRGLRGLLASWALPWGDLVMMRRQLLNLKALAERSAPGSS